MIAFIAGASVSTILAEAKRLADWAMRDGASSADRNQVRENLVAIDGVLITRVVNLIWARDLDDLQTAHRWLMHFLASPEGDALRRLDPHRCAGWNGVAEVLFRAARIVSVAAELAEEHQPLKGAK